jgi:hypothetical protein
LIEMLYFTAPGIEPSAQDKLALEQEKLSVSEAKPEPGESFQPAPAPSISSTSVIVPSEEEERAQVRESVHRQEPAREEGEEEMVRDDDDAVDWRRCSFSEDADPEALKLAKLARESTASEAELQERLKKWVEWQGGLMRGSDRGAWGVKQLSDVYNGRTVVSVWDVLKLEQTPPWKFDGELWLWETPERHEPIEEAGAWLEKFGVEGASAKRLREWSKGRGVKLLSLCKHELILRVAAQGERSVYLLLAELRKGIRPWFFL